MKKEAGVASHFEFVGNLWDLIMHLASHVQMTLTNAMQNKRGALMQFVIVMTTDEPMAAELWGLVCSRGRVIPCNRCWLSLLLLLLLVDDRLTDDGLD